MAMMISRRPCPVPMFVDQPAGPRPPRAKRAQTLPPASRPNPSIVPRRGRRAVGARDPAGTGDGPRPAQATLEPRRSASKRTTLRPRVAARQQATLTARVLFPTPTLRLTHATT